MQYTESKIIGIAGVISVVVTFVMWCCKSLVTHRFNGQEPNYSFLMSVYKKENAANLRTAMDSMWNQTIPTNDFVLVCDGPLTIELDTVIDEMIQAHGKYLNVVRLKENKDLGYALNVGIEHCKNALVARMDSDDISFPNRFEKQLSVFTSMPEISI